MCVNRYLEENKASVRGKRKEVRKLKEQGRMAGEREGGREDVVGGSEGRYDMARERGREEVK